jgi:hypothetical protein
VIDLRSQVSDSFRSESSCDNVLTPRPKGLKAGLGYPVVLGDNIQEAKSLSFTGLLPSLVALFQRPLTRDSVFTGGCLPGVST